MSAPGLRASQKDRCVRILSFASRKIPSRSQNLSLPANSASPSPDRLPIYRRRVRPIQQAHRAPRIRSPRLTNRRPHEFSRSVKSFSLPTLRPGNERCSHRHLSFSLSICRSSPRFRGSAPRNRRCRSSDKRSRELCGQLRRQRRARSSRARKRARRLANFEFRISLRK